MGSSHDQSDDGGREVGITFVHTASLSIYIYICILARKDLFFLLLAPQLRSRSNFRAYRVRFRRSVRLCISKTDRCKGGQQARSHCQGGRGEGEFSEAAAAVAGNTQSSNSRRSRRSRRSEVVCDADGRFRKFFFSSIKFFFYLIKKKMGNFDSVAYLIRELREG
ncbi:hypothetical protein BD324DRAFT_619912 [Kockovaella imperatae]|uniref:Uncharacterized protein n=1 Tax=Kockovaella imperatae TaxID=4999 RepID=A0A1Y1UJG1_9TREE|nr:hypothetical protein BD324DRAFT_619912 [Kockovaella imperatae]ORX38193.1 hypothetical protein BD324DRAFT_619912 [Kockovaella imperatae]